MGSLNRWVDNQQGSAIIIAILILFILTVVGTVAINISNTELKYSRNDIERKQMFYYTESAGREVAYDVDKTTTGRYAVLDTATPIIVTKTAAGPTTPNPTAAQVTDYTDTTWPINTSNVDSPDLTSLRSHEYGYRVYYTGLGLNPKGFGSSFSSFVFDIGSREQETVGGNTELRSAAIIQGFRKIGPKS